jgi:ech hydrogenase subunit F
MFEMLTVVVKSLLHKAATRNYPYVVRPTFERARGHITNEIEACIFCGACARRCPVHALEVARAERRWVIDPFRCIVCGACVEVCPKSCLTMEISYNKPALVMSTTTMEGPAPAPHKPRPSPEQNPQGETPNGEAFPKS